MKNYVAFRVPEYQKKLERKLRAEGRLDAHLMPDALRAAHLFLCQEIDSLDAATFHSFVDDLRSADPKLRERMSRLFPWEPVFKARAKRLTEEVPVVSNSDQSYFSGNKTKEE